MKKKVAILLAAVMTTAAVPMNVMASSSNQINKTVTKAVNKAIDDVYLNITPNDEIASGDTIALTIEGAEFFETEAEGGTKIDDDTYYFDTYQYSLDNTDYGKMDFDEISKTIDDSTTVLTLMGAKKGGPTNELPFKLTRNSSKEIEVELFPLTENQVGVKNGNSETKVYYKIPLPMKATSTGDIKVSVDANETSISGGGTYTIGTAVSSSGSTTTTIEEVKNFEDIGEIKTITIREDVAETFEKGKEVTLRLGSGFVFSNSSNIQITPGINAPSFTQDELKLTYNNDRDEVTFIMPFSKGKDGKAAAIKITGMRVQADDDDEDWGDVKLTVSGAGISKETIKIAERKELGFAMTVLEDVPTIIAGRFENGKGSAKIYDDDCVTAQFKFEETVPNTWLAQRKLEFSVPEGVQIYDWEFDDEEEVKFKSDAELANDNKTLKIDRDSVVLGNDKNSNGTTDDTAEFKLKLYLSVDADYEGEVPVSVKGGGIAEGEIDDIVVANVICPISISSQTTKTNMGYQSVDTADITITEAKEGAFLKNGEVVVYLDASFGNQEIGFADEGIDYEIDGELEITNFKVSDGEIIFKVDKESYTEPSSITFKNLKVGTTRSVPYGSFDICVRGEGVINNYDDDGVDHGVGFSDVTDSYAFDDYLTIGTVTGTFDDVVKVTIGEKTILINDEAQDMDVAPYIQASSNSTMVPLRFVAVALGVDPASISNPDESSKVAWDANTKTVTIYYGAGTGQKIVQFTAGSNTMLVDGSPIPMEYGVVAEIKDGRMFVPFRALGNALGINVTWDADTRTATYNGDK